MYGFKTYAFIVTLILFAVTCVISQAVPLSGTGFAGFMTGTSVDGQSGWSSTGIWDEEVVDDGTGNLVWRVSNAFTSGSFGNMPFAPRPGGIPTDSVNDPVNSEPLFFAGESSTGAAFNSISGQFSFRSATGASQNGLLLTVSLDNGTGGRQSIVYLVDTGSGIDIQTFDVDEDTGEFSDAITIASGLSYTDWHTVKMDAQFADGPHNDTVKYYIDDELEHVGPSWEEFYRKDPDNENQDVSNPLGVPVQTLIFRLHTPDVPAVAGGGFYIDNVFTSNSEQEQPPQRPQRNRPRWGFHRR